MIKTPTLFVLGAGASVSYRFPTGYELRRRICAELRRGYVPFSLVERSGVNEAAILGFRDDFERSAIGSIDSFIAMRPKYRDIGELAIASILLPLEQTHALTNVSGQQGNGGWYQLLWNAMMADVSSVDQLLGNDVGFITFNYDRSFEAFLLNAIQSTFDLEIDAAFAILSKFRLKHVYGSLGEFIPNAGFQFGGHNESSMLSAILAAKSSIKTVPAVRPTKDEVASEWLSYADRVFVLGFGFDPTNCERIGLADACSNARQKTTPRHVFCSAFNQTQSELRLCESFACHRGQGGLIWTNGDCMALLRDRREYLT